MSTMLFLLLWGCCTVLDPLLQYLQHCFLLRFAKPLLLPYEMYDCFSSAGMLVIEILRGIVLSVSPLHLFLPRNRYCFLPSTAFGFELVLFS